MRNKATLLFRLAPNYKSGANFFFFTESTTTNSFSSKIGSNSWNKIYLVWKEIENGNPSLCLSLNKQPSLPLSQTPHTHKHSLTPTHTTRITLAHTLCHTHAHTHTLSSKHLSLFSLPRKHTNLKS